MHSRLCLCKSEGNPISRDPIFISVDSCVNKEMAKNKGRSVNMDFPKAITMHLLFPLNFNSLQMKSCFQACILISWGQMQPFFGAWPGGMQYEPISTTPSGWVVRWLYFTRTYNAFHRDSALFGLKWRACLLKSCSLNLIYEVEPWRNVCKYILNRCKGLHEPTFETAPPDGVFCVKTEPNCSRESVWKALKCQVVRQSDF